MLIWLTLATELLLILPALSQVITTNCEISSVEAGDDATLTVHFGDDLIQKQDRDLQVKHLDRNNIETKMLDCEVSNGDVECDKTPCCTWESKVTDVFRVYIHNASQQLEGRFWGFVIPGDTKYQQFCDFTLKASTCPTDHINATNSEVTCNKQSVTIGQSCTVTCNSGHYFQENQTSVTYTCVGRNKWSPEIPVTSCEAPTCSRDSINVTNSRLTCHDKSFTVGQTCTVICNTNHYFQGNQTFVTYKCVGKNRWFPEIPVICCEEKPKVHEASNLYFLFLLLIVIPIGIAIGIVLKQRRQRRKKKECIEEFIVETRRMHGNQTKPLLPIKSSELQESQRNAEDYWLKCIRAWYPELQEKTYFLPPFHFKSVTYKKENVAGYEVQVPLPLQDSDVRDDKAIERVLQCLHTLADDPQHKEVMMVISQLQFGKYRGKPSYTAAVDLSLPSPLPGKFVYMKDGCDVLIIHRTLGLLTLEIRSVGENFSQPEITEQNQDNVVMKEIKKAIKQLKRAEVVLKHLTSDILATIQITNILVLPYISSSQLQRAVKRTSDRKCLGVLDVDDVVKLCLLSDQLSDQQMSSDGNHNSSQALREWWQQLVMAFGPEQLMTSSLYEQLVARFCGPASTVEVHCVTAPRLNIRTLGEAVSETGERVTRLVLFPQQVDILNRSPPGAFLSGPPGTGKTIVLIMQGLTWLQRGHDVHVVSTWDESRAVTIVIEHQLQETAKTSTARSRVHRHQFDFKKDREVETAFGRLKSMSEGRQLCVIADEVVHYRKLFTEFCDQLFVQVPGVFIWGASVYHYVRPFCLEEVKLTTPLRSPPVVVRVVMQAEEIQNYEDVHNYTVSDVPVPTDGPPVMRFEHLEGQLDHTEVRPRDCVECGHQIARVLTELDVGRTGDSNGPPSLQYRDVLVLFYDCPTDDEVKRFDLKIATASGLVKGLRDCQVPVREVEKGDEAAIRDMALGVGDLVTVANCLDVQGLERKVVVVERGSGEVDSYETLLAMSRCTSQLVLIDWWSCLMSLVDRLDTEQRDDYDDNSDDCNGYTLH